MISSDSTKNVAFDAQATIRIAVLMTSFNRRETTLGCLSALAQQQVPGATLEVYLVDDGSSDGTFAAVQQQHPSVHLEKGPGNLFWNRGMHRAFEQALLKDFDFYLWLNDDTILVERALEGLLKTALSLQKKGIEAIVTGATVDASTGQQTYGGMVRVSKAIPPLFGLAKMSTTELVSCDTMNGNCTLIPRAVCRAVGNLDRHFQHNFGDMDYGLRARKRGFQVVMATGWIGTCSENSIRNTWKDTEASFSERWDHLMSPKGSPWREWSYFARRHLGVLWPIYAASPYVKLILQAPLCKTR